MKQVASAMMFLMANILVHSLVVASFWNADGFLFFGCCLIGVLDIGGIVTVFLSVRQAPEYSETQTMQPQIQLKPDRDYLEWLKAQKERTEQTIERVERQLKAQEDAELLRKLTDDTDDK